MLVADERIELDPRPVPAQEAVLEVVLLGHCPDGSGVRWDRLARDETLLGEISRLGLTREADALRALLRESIAQKRGAGAGEESAVPAAQADSLRRLCDLPIPLGSLGLFQALFPAALVEGGSAAADGEAPWLPLAVQDFFRNSTVRSPLRLWVIRVPEELGMEAFLPVPGADRLHPEELGAFDRALLIPRAGIVALPDLERLMLPRSVREEPASPRVASLPVFHPSSDAETAPPPPGAPPKGRSVGAPSVDAATVASRIAVALAQRRPDLQCLLSVPATRELATGQPVPDGAFLATLAGAGSVVPGEEENAPALAVGLRHLQFLYPYLRGSDGVLRSASGAVAGMQAAVSQEQGPWRSVGGRLLPGNPLPWPPVPPLAAVALRRDPGVTVIVRRGGRTVVDDERICAPCLSPAELRGLPPARRGEEQWYSAEVVRFLGWLRRELMALGERLIFEVNPRDPRPALVLRAFFTGLLTRGALRGGRPEEAFRLVDNSGAETVAFDIEIAPAYPLDRLRVTFLQERSLPGSTGIEFSHE